jgi:hypothetical protein
MNRTRSFATVLAAALLFLAVPHASALTLADVNLLDLLRDAQAIVVGTVQSVSDGVDAQGVPYTEITVEIAEPIRGNLSGTHTFRQFGLREARLTADGTKRLMPTAAFPRYQEGESVVLFLYPPAAWTGLQTTVGLGAGKFVLGPGRAENGFANEGTFRNVSVDPGLTSDLDDRVLSTEVGAVNPGDLLALVRRATEERWVETCKMWKSDVGKTCPRTPTLPKPPKALTPDLASGLDTHLNGF